MFNVGDLVVCKRKIPIAPGILAQITDSSIPFVGGIYTITNIIPPEGLLNHAAPLPEIHLQFLELTSPPQIEFGRYITTGGLAYPQSYFEKVVKPSIEVFRTILADLPKTPELV